MSTFGRDGRAVADFGDEPVGNADVDGVRLRVLDKRDLARCI